MFVEKKRFDNVVCSSQLTYRSPLIEVFQQRTCAFPFSVVVVVTAETISGVSA